MAVVTCKGCNRAVRATDVDRDGRCCFCERPKAAPVPEAVAEHPRLARERAKADKAEKSDEE